MTEQLITRLECDAADLELIGDSVEMILASVKRTAVAMERLAIRGSDDVARVERARQRLISALGSLGGQLDLIEA
ncbi:MAG: hypothetical protein ABIR68_00030 [Ilumatobacteraceae bacterium]